MSCLLGRMKQSRQEGRSDNQTVQPGLTFYGRAVVRLLGDDLNVLLEEPFTGDLPRLDYLIDVAEEMGAMVTVRQDVYLFDGGAGKICDGGYEIQIFPLFAMREGNDFVPLDEDDHDDNDNENELVH